MDAQSFMYWAIGGGVIVLVLFFSIALFYVVRILKDISEATESVRETAEAVNENVQDLAGKVTSTADQILTYFVKPFAIFQFFADKVKPFMDMIPNMHADDEDEEEEEPKRKRRSNRRKKK